MSPPTQRSAAAAITPSGAPPMPISTSTPVSSKQVAMPPATSPSSMRRMRAPADAHLADQLLVARAVEDDHGQVVHLAAAAPAAMARRFSVGLLRRSMAPRACGPTAIFSM